MVAPAAGAVVLVRFPFSDLSQTKLRPAVVLADAGRGDWILCQVTSKPYGDASALTLEDASFAAGSLRVTSYARPGKLFTANQDLIVAQVGTLKSQALSEILNAVVDLLRAGRSQ
ncbi:MAG: type II toxin-antitoxin system PemK/MazF family toxin [Deltaproteobacteria bacterium]|nr:type II toxin-antitoxin system PemK/MazF family toxin [Deltaproteobacteria bacterium]